MGEIGADCILLFFGVLQTKARYLKSLSFSLSSLGVKLKVISGLPLLEWAGPG